MEKEFEFDKVYQVLQKIYQINRIKEHLILAGGIVPYVLLDKCSQRLHSDIDFICNIGEINNIKKELKNYNYYDENLDSQYTLDAESGFEFYVDQIKVGVYPFEEKNGKIYQYSYDALNKINKLKIVNLSSDEYIQKKDDYKIMALEVILKSKIIAYRPKDKLDIDLICQIGIDSNIYSKLKIDFDIKKVKCDRI